MTETDSTSPLGGPEQATAKERPAHRRSIFFDHESRIRALIADGWSYRQILGLLRLKHMNRSVLARWCRRQGIVSTATSSSNPSTRRAADKKPATASPASAAMRRASPTAAPTRPASLADAYDPEPIDPLAGLRPSRSLK